ncbi:MAG TPA: zinc ribbon domain-containing protein [Thermoanaerobaculia bacterium]|nr:zinc ribbon domain-containing protein [Thermoanaerobaculia bacterium]
MKSCVACNHSIDDQARLCPYCGADPVSGEKVDTQAVIEQVFHSKKLSTADTVLDYARRRQGIVVALVAMVVFLILAAVHSFVTARNSAVSSGPAISLSEIADAANEKTDTQPAPMPALKYQYDGRGHVMQTFINEPGAVAPAPAPVPAPAAPPQPAPAPAKH